MHNFLFTSLIVKMNYLFDKTLIIKEIKKYSSHQKNITQSVGFSAHSEKCRCLSLLNARRIKSIFSPGS